MKELKILWEFLTSNGTIYVEWMDGKRRRLRRLTQEQYDKMFKQTAVEEDDLEFLN